MVPTLSNKSEFYLNAEWIEQALKYSGTISKSAAVSSIEASTLSGGFMADTYLITIKYARSNELGPTSVVAKFPSSNPSSLAAGQEMGAYLREINFYKYLAPKLKGLVRRSYWNSNKSYFLIIGPQ